MPDTGENASINADLLGLNGPAAFQAAVDQMPVAQIAGSLATQYGVGVAAAWLTSEFGLPVAAAIGTMLGYTAGAFYDYYTGGTGADTGSPPAMNFDFSGAVTDPATGQVMGYW